MRADDLLDQGDLDGAAAWRRIIKAIEELASAVLLLHYNSIPS